MFRTAATRANAAISGVLCVSAAITPYATVQARIGSLKKAQMKKTTMTATISSRASMESSSFSCLRGFLDGALQRCAQSRRHERGEAVFEQPRVVAVLGLRAGDELHGVGGGERVGEGAEHEVHA